MATEQGRDLGRLTPPREGSRIRFEGGSCWYPTSHLPSCGRWRKGVRAEYIGPEAVHAAMRIQVRRGLPVEEAHRIAAMVRERVRQTTGCGYCLIHAEAADEQESGAHSLAALDQLTLRDAPAALSLPKSRGTG